MKKYYIGVLAVLFLVAPVSAQDSTEERPAFTLGTGDVLHISVWGEEDLDLEVTVRPDGRISFPLVNDLEVTGLTPDEVRNRLTQRIGTFIRDPNVTVVVAEIHSFRVYVLGEVNTQGALNFRGPTRVLEAIAEAGGLTEYSKKQIVLLRDQPDGGQSRTVIDYKRILQGDAARNVFLQPGDTLLVN